MQPRLSRTASIIATTSITKHTGATEEVVKVALVLATDDSSYIVGESSMAA